MKIHWESENMAWGCFIQLSFEAFYFCFTLAGIDVQFHIHNFRDIVYQSSTGSTNNE